MASNELNDQDTSSEVETKSGLLIKNFREEGELIGLKGKELTSYVQNSLLTHYESERERERAERESEKEREARAFELEKARLELERVRITNEGRLNENFLPKKESNLASSKPKLPYFDEKADDIESYLFRFEVHAKALGWEITEWPVALAALLKGKALTFYRELPVQKASDYNELRDHLFKRFHCTEEGFRQKFRGSKPESGESLSTFGFKLRRFADRWTELAEADDVQKLKDLIVKEQFLSSIPLPVATFLKERMYSDFEEMVLDAERYQEAHLQSQPLSKSNPFSTNVGFTQPHREMNSGKSGGNYPTNRENRWDKKYQNFKRPAYGGNDNPSNRFNRDQGKPKAQKSQPNKNCYLCNNDSHYAHSCPKLPELQKLLSAKEKANVGFVKGMSAVEDLPANIQTCAGTCNGTAVDIMLDSGCTTVGVRRNLVSKDQLTGEIRTCKQFDGSVVELPIANISLDCAFFSGKVSACVIDDPACDVILGKVPGCSFECTHIANAVQTRAQWAKDNKPFRPLLTAKAPQLSVNAKECRELQDSDLSLIKLFERVQMPGKDVGGSREEFSIRDGLLYRRVVNLETKQTVWQLVVPKGLQESVLIAAHDGIFGGHMGAGSTFKKIKPFFFWPGYRKDTKDYCRSCSVCQKTYPKGRVPAAPLQKTPLIDTPFSRVAIDLIGPINPPSSQGHRWVLTLVDVATRYPEAIPLKSISTEAVAEALVEIFSRLGIPDEILSDRGSQFTSDVMREVYRLLSVAQVLSAPYHPQTNGLVERFNASLKTMLKRLMTSRPKDWDRYIPAALFAYREIPQESSGFSPFELLYGRLVKGPSQLLYDTWTQREKDSERLEVSEYVTKLSSLLQERVKEAQEAIQEVSSQSRKRQKLKAKARAFKEGEKVLVLLPTNHNKMLLKWFGPYSITKKVREHDYLVETDKGVQKLFHVNLLRKFVERQDCTIAGASVSVMTDEDTDFEKVELFPVPVQPSETIADVKYHESLSLSQKIEAETVLSKHSKILSDLPGTVTIAEHRVNLNSEVPVKVKQYPLPFQAEETVRKEVDKMLKLGVIEPSQSPYSSPVLLVKKPDGSARFVLDFRKLNQITEFDAEPIPDPELLFSKLEGKKFFSKLDLAKGYWQIPMRECDKPKTAFQTPQGLFHFVKMPFGLSTAPSTFARMMRMLDLEEHDAFNFFDDILIASDDWDEHMKCLDQVLTVLSEKGLTVRPSKVEIGMNRIEFLGHCIGEKGMSPRAEKVSKVLNISPPTTKKQVRALLGLVGFYRRYIPNFASLVAPLTELTKKNLPTKVVWTNRCQQALEQVKEILSSDPVVVLPDFGKDFTIRTDASSTGLGAVLLQRGADELLHPVLYASRKLLDRETRYAAVERECLAVVWAIDKFHRYVYGRQFFVETDHRPLTFLSHAKTTNQRLMRWALALQDYSFSIVPIAGTRNHEADVLSRM